MDVLIAYVLNGDKTNEKILTAYQNCTSLNPCQTMRRTKERYGKTEGVESYHVIQAFEPGEISPEQALEIARSFATEYLSDYEAVIGVHQDRDHTHAHIVFNSVSCVDGHKYHSTPTSYFEQIRGISDRLCREHGLSVIIRGETGKAVSYFEWRQNQQGAPTQKDMLFSDIRLAIGKAADFGHFLMLMEHMGYEIKHGKHIAFRPYGAGNFIRPGRRDAQFTEESIRAAIIGSLEAQAQGLRPVYPMPKPYAPFRPRAKLKGFMALYVHYLYLLGKIKKREYPPRVTPHLRQAAIKFEMYREQFRFMRANGIETVEQLREFRSDSEESLSSMAKQRTILNVRKSKRKALFAALTDAEALLPAKELYVSGVAGIEDEFAKYMDAAKILDESNISREQLSKEKSELYGALSDINRDMRVLRKEIALCEDILGSAPRIEKDIQSISTQQRKMEVTRDDHKRR